MSNIRFRVELIAKIRRQRKTKNAFLPNSSNSLRYETQAVKGIESYRGTCFQGVCDLPRSINTVVMDGLCVCLSV